MTEHLDELIEGCKRADISLDFILPLVRDKPQEYVTDVINHLNCYADSIPPDSALGGRLGLIIKEEE